MHTWNAIQAVKELWLCKAIQSGRKKLPTNQGNILTKFCKFNKKITKIGTANKHMQPVHSYREHTQDEHFNLEMYL